MMDTRAGHVLEAVAVIYLIAVLVAALLGLSVVPAVGRSATAAPAAAPAATAPPGWSGGISVIGQVTVVVITTPSR
jgi:hypothetical protein